MPSEIDIYRSASVLIRQHGNGAALKAAQAMPPESDMEGAAV